MSYHNSDDEDREMVYLLCLLGVIIIAWLPL
jgi:hypothetical protein